MSAENPCCQCGQSSTKWMPSDWLSAVRLVIEVVLWFVR